MNQDHWVKVWEMAEQGDPEFMTFQQLDIKEMTTWLWGAGNAYVFMINEKMSEFQLEHGNYSSHEFSVSYEITNREDCEKLIREFDPVLFYVLPEDSAESYIYLKGTDNLASTLRFHMIGNVDYSLDNPLEKDESNVHFREMTTGEDLNP